MHSWPGRPLRAAVLILTVTVGSACAPSLSEPSVGPRAFAPGERVARDGALTESEIDRIEATRVEQLIEGRFPGVRVIHRPNGEYTLMIRGARSFYGKSEPLIVIDGMPAMSATSLMGIHPNDIARIQVLKDASAVSYGIRGANGVILITTRKS